MLFGSGAESFERFSIWYDLARTEAQGSPCCFSPLRVQASLSGWLAEETNKYSLVALNDMDNTNPAKLLPSQQKASVKAERRVMVMVIRP